MRRLPSKEIRLQLLAFVQDPSKALPSRIAAVYALIQTDDLFKSMAQSSGHPHDDLLPFVIRAIGDTKTECILRLFIGFRKGSQIRISTHHP